DRVLGVLSETDVLYKETKARDRQGIVDWVLHYSDDPPAAKLTARTAGDAMTSPAVTIPPARSVADAATILLKLRIERVPGVVSVDSKLSVREAGTPTARPLTPVQ